MGEYMTLPPKKLLLLDQDLHDFHRYLDSFMTASEDEKPIPMMHEFVSISKEQQWSRHDVIWLTIAVCQAIRPLVSTLSNILHYLLINPSEKERLLQNTEPNKRSDLIHELIIKNVSIRNMLRIAKKNKTVNGHVFQAGDQVEIDLPKVNRDFLASIKAGKKNISDLPFHLSFGLGNHRCPGGLISYFLIKSIVQALFERFPNMTIRNSVPVHWYSTDITHSIKNLPVKLT
ncbi:MAG: cytochrome P450 [Magnetococcales bacterium]|nr:cytochrome P450 [Magnetococcales bacterium]